MAAMAATAASAAAAYLTRLTVGVVMGVLHPSAGPVPPERRFVAGAMACRVRRLDVAVAVTGTAVVVGVLVTAVALRDGIGGLGRSGGWRRRRSAGRAVHRPGMVVVVRHSWLGRSRMRARSGPGR